MYGGFFGLSRLWTSCGQTWKRSWKGIRNFQNWMTVQVLLSGKALCLQELLLYTHIHVFTYACSVHIFLSLITHCVMLLKFSIFS